MRAQLLAHGGRAAAVRTPSVDFDHSADDRPAVLRRRLPVWQLLAFDLTAPLLLSAAAVHELLYNAAGPGTWLLTLAVIWPLVARRRAPVAVLMMCLAVGVTLWATRNATVADLSLLVALYSVAAHRPTRCALVAGGAVEVGALLVAIRFAPAGSVNDAVILLSGLVAAALLLGTTMRAQRRYLLSVEDRARQLELERAQQAALVAAGERTRIAREMHDIVAHGLSVVITLSQGAAVVAETDPKAAAQAMEQAASAGRQSLDEMRRLLSVLRADTAIDTRPQPDLAALDVLVDDVRRTGLVVHTHGHGNRDRLSATVQAALYRIVQEALTNVLKHAEGATCVSVALDVGKDEVWFAVDDDGRLMSADGVPRAGNGLTGMSERVALFNGSLDSGPSESGWSVRGRLPLT